MDQSAERLCANMDRKLILSHEHHQDVAQPQPLQTQLSQVTVLRHNIPPQNASIDIYETLLLLLLLLLLSLFNR